MISHRCYKLHINHTAHKAKRSITGKTQRGVAIITALLIVAIASTVSITVSTRLQLDVRRTGNLIALDQADAYLIMAETWSRQILLKDKEEDSTIDALDEDWAMELSPLPVEGGSIQGKLTDLHSCININSLLANGAVDTTTQSRLARLFSNLGLKGISYQAIQDWIDDDLNTANPDGAEDSYYLNLDKPYRTANSPLYSISEMRLIKGFEDTENYRKLVNSQALCAFIGNNNQNINVNTASAEVLKSLASGMTDSIVNDIIKHREETPFNDLKDFTDFASLGNIIKNRDREKLSVSSDYFLLRTQAIIGQANKIMYSIIYRDQSGKTEVISRSYRTL